MSGKKEIWFVVATGFILNIDAAPLKFITRSYDFDLPEIIEQADSSCRVVLDNTVPENIPGQPLLPHFRTSFEIPDGYEVETVTLIRGDIRTVPLTSPVEWGQPVYKPGDQPLFCAPDPLIYLSDELYPAANALRWRCDPTDGSTLFSISFAPLQYQPRAGKLHCSAGVTVHLSLIESRADSMQLIQKLNAPPSPLDPEERCDYLIISTSNLIARAAPPYDFNALLAVRRRSGFITRLISVEWIYANYAGADPPARIRRFLQDAHALWGLKYLLIAGTHQLIPARKLYISVPAFFLTYTDEIPSDHIYYGCMEGSYDGNGNGRYGEYNDGDNGGDVDLTAEILTGRFPVANEIELAHMIRKTLRHEEAVKEEFFHNGFISEKVDFGTIVYAEPFMEEIRNGSSTYNRINLGYTNSPYDSDFITTNNLHDRDGYLFSRTEALNYLTNRLYSINHLGHGARYQCMKLNVLNTNDYSSLAALQNPFPYFVYSQACESGAFDTPDCFAEQLVTVSNAAAAVVMNSRNGWASSGSVSGYSHYFHRYFWDGAFRGSATTYGEMNEYARRKNLSSVPQYNGSFWRWVYYELNLLGDPAMPVLPALLNVRPEFSHTPLSNTFNTAADYTVRCHLNPVGIFDPGSVFLTWQSSALSGVVHTQPMEPLSGNLFQSALPPQPANTRIQYRITATNRAGYVNFSPVSESHTFHVTDELNLQIIGSPLNTGVCEPDYGSYSSASGLVVVAECAALSDAGESTRYVCQGFVGTGSAPSASTNRFVSFRIDMNSMIIWLWQKEYRVRVSSTPELTPASIYWVSAGETLSVPQAERFIQDAQSNTFAFAGWELDGVRSPALPAASVPRYPALSVSAGHTLTALYIPAALDSDGNGIADWWELQYFGAPGQDIFADHDQDGYDIYEEFADLSDPLDPQSVPAPPLIVHPAPAAIRNHPGPVEISAVITDTDAVTAAAVLWRVRSGEWQTTPLTLTSNALYQAQIAPISAPGDNIEYRLEASDPSGNLARTESCHIFLAYPVADCSELSDLFVLTQPDRIAVTNRSALYNRGNSLLTWNLAFGKEEQFLSPSLEQLYNWNTVSIEQPWVISTNHAFSPPYAMHAALLSTKGAAHHASITMPAVTIGAGARLSFAYWIDAETYVRVDPTRAFDGGIVEYSNNGGESFRQLAGPYTHTIYGYALSPWPDRTPCFAGLSFGWQTALFDLMTAHPEENGFEGQSVIFRFVYGGDDNTDHEGWYIDDIRISPTTPPAGFTYTLPPLNPFMTTPGYYSELLWRNLPQIIASRDENTTLILTSNDPVNPAHSFFWQTKIRQNPQILSCSVAQITNGQGTVALAAGVYEPDQEPLTLTLEWSHDRGHNWQGAALTDISTTPRHSTLPGTAANGVIAPIPGATNSIPVTNRVNAVWNSAAPECAITWNSNITMRITAASPWYKTVRTEIFAVDNVAPQFTSGTLAAAPRSRNGDYLITPDQISLTWPDALETPPYNPVLYAILSGTDLLAICTNATTAWISMTNRLDQYSTITVTPSDPIGNSGEPLELTALILDPLSDYDQDGSVTAHEELAGTDAKNPQSVFIINRFAAEGANSFGLSWTTVSGRSYSIESTPQLSAAAWTPLAGFTGLPGTGNVISVALPPGTGAAYYRVRVE